MSWSGTAVPIALMNAWATRLFFLWIATVTDNAPVGKPGAER